MFLLVLILFNQFYSILFISSFYLSRSNNNSYTYLLTYLHTEGISVWLDKISLQPGEPWEEGFCRGMAMSRIFIPILSRSAVKNNQQNRNNLELLEADSPCDNVILGL